MIFNILGITYIISLVEELRERVTLKESNWSFIYYIVLNYHTKKKKKYAGQTSKRVRSLPLNNNVAT